MMNRIVLVCSVFASCAIAGACARQPTVAPAEFGETVRRVLEYQIHDYEAALHPTPNAVEGSDPDRLNGALEVHRGDVTEPQRVRQPLSINVGSQ